LKQIKPRKSGRWGKDERKCEVEVDEEDNEKSLRLSYCLQRNPSSSNNIKYIHLIYLRTDTTAADVIGEHDEARHGDASDDP